MMLFAAFLGNRTTMVFIDLLQNLETNCIFFGYANGNRSLKRPSTKGCECLFRYLANPEITKQSAKASQPKLDIKEHVHTLLELTRYWCAF